MLSRPLFKPHLQVEPLPPDQVFLLTESQSYLLRGELYLQLSTLIDGERTLQEIHRELGHQFSMVEVCYALLSLEQEGFVIEGNREPSPTTDLRAAYWYALDQSPEHILRTLRSSSVSIRQFGSDRSIPGLSPWVGALLSALIDQQISVSSVSEDSSFEIVVTDDYLHPELKIYNQKALQTQRAWLLVKPLGTQPFLGPIFVPPSTGCWQCLAYRYRQNQPVRTLIEQRTGRTVPLTQPLSPAALQLMVGYTLETILQWLTHPSDHPLINTLVTLDLHTLTLDKHHLTKRPQCPVCGNVELQSQQMLQPITLSPCPKRSTRDGGYRCRSPEVTLAHYRSQIDPLLGSVRELERISSQDEPLIHNYSAFHWFPHMEMNSATLPENLFVNRSGGKGKTAAQAQASGLCEALERYSGCCHGDELFKFASYSNLGELAIDPNQCLLFSESQYQQRQQWNRVCPRPQRVPEPFDPNVEIGWSPIWSLTHEVFKYLPTSYCFYGFTDSNATFCYTDSNGCAAGNTLEEAILQGFLELVERDCAAIWWYNQLSRPQVNLSSFIDPYFQEIEEFYHSIHRDLWVIDITHDLEIPTFVAVSKPETGDPADGAIAFGFGCHLDATIAIARALTEVNQVRAALHLGRNNRGGLKNRPIPVEWFSKTFEDLPYLAPNPELSPRTAGDYLQHFTSDIYEDIMLCRSMVESRGMEMLVLNQTRPDIGLAVVKVIVPGLRHFWKRWAPGRLYTVPVTLGWLADAKFEAQLNPLPIFF